MQPRRAALQLILDQIVRKGGRAALPADRLSGVIQHLAVKQRLGAELNIIGIRVQIDIPRIFTD